MKKFQLKQNKLRILRKSNYLPSFLSQALIGLILGDAHLSKSTSNTRFEMSFKGIYLPFASYIYALFIYYIGSKPNILNTKSNISDKLYGSIRLKSLTLPIFNYYHNLFYQWDISLGKWIKFVPSNIKDLMTPVVLAFLIMGDGNYDKSRNRVRIYTNSFTYSDCLLLANAIEQKCGIKTSVMHDRNNQYILTIGAKELDKLRSLVSEHMHPTMNYRIGLPNSTI